MTQNELLTKRELNANVQSRSNRRGVCTGPRWGQGLAAPSKSATICFFALLLVVPGASQSQPPPSSLTYRGWTPPPELANCTTDGARRRAPSYSKEPPFRRLPFSDETSRAAHPHASQATTASPSLRSAATFPSTRTTATHALHGNLPRLSATTSQEATWASRISSAHPPEGSRALSAPTASRALRHSSCAQAVPEPATPAPW